MGLSSAEFAEIEPYMARNFQRRMFFVYHRASLLEFEEND
jgi:hypothetical protein